MIFYGNYLIAVEFCRDSIKNIVFSLFSLLQNLYIQKIFVNLHPIINNYSYGSNRFQSIADSSASDVRP